MMWMIETDTIEEKYTKATFWYKPEFINAKVRNAFLINKLKMLIVKSLNENNCYSKKDAFINKD